MVLSIPIAPDSNGSWSKGKVKKLDTSQLIGWAWLLLKWAVTGFGVTVVVAFLIYLATGRNGDLVAWFSDVTPIYPSEQTKYLTLPLFLSGEQVESLSFVNIQLSNAGKVGIGFQDKQWTLHITGPPEAIVTTIGDPLPSSKRLVVTSAASSNANRIAVQVGLLEPREFFDLRFIVANASHVSSSSLKVGTSLEGLRKPILTGAPPEVRASSILFPWLWGVFYVGVMALVITEKYLPNSVPHLTGSLPIWGKALGFFLVALAYAAVLAKVIGWIAVKLWQLGILR